MLTVLRLQLFHVVAVLFYAANRCLRGIVIVLHKIILLQVLYSVLPNVMTHGCSVRSPMTAFITAMSCYELTVCVWSDKKKNLHDYSSLLLRKEYPLSCTQIAYELHVQGCNNIIVSTQYV